MSLGPRLYAPLGIRQFKWLIRLNRTNEPNDSYPQEILLSWQILCKQKDLGENKPKLAKFWFIKPMSLFKCLQQTPIREG